jgi:phage terminase small subunit
MKALSERERRFVDAYMGKAAGNATKAAELAGYSQKTCRQQGARLLTKVSIQAAIKQRAESDPLARSREERQQFWRDVMAGTGKFAKTAMKDRLKASELLGKTQGDFVQRIEIGNSAPLFTLPAGVRVSVSRDDTAGG